MLLLIFPLISSNFSSFSKFVSLECLNICRKGVFLQVLPFASPGPAYCLTILFGFAWKKDGRFFCLFVYFFRAFKAALLRVLCMYSWQCFGAIRLFLSFKVHFKELRGKKLVCLCVCVYSFFERLFVWILFLFSFFLGRVALDWQIVPSELGKKIERSGLCKVVLNFFLVFMRNSSNNCFKNVIRRFRVFLLLASMVAKRLRIWDFFLSFFLT